jgi:hypothetical protein
VAKLGVEDRVKVQGMARESTGSRGQNQDRSTACASDEPWPRRSAKTEGAPAARHWPIAARPRSRRRVGPVETPAVEYTDELGEFLPRGGCDGIA